MSLFFKGYINPILSGEFEHYRALQVAVVYSGGDDVFLVGAWTDVLEGRGGSGRLCAAIPAAR